MSNWYKELKKIHTDTPIILIAVRENDNKYGYDKSKCESKSGSLEDVKELIDYEFDSGYGGENGPSFTAWTTNRVYFPVMYDGSEWISSVPRNPCDEATGHQGE